MGWGVPSSTPTPSQGTVSRALRLIQPSNDLSPLPQHLGAGARPKSQWLASVTIRKPLLLPTKGPLLHTALGLRIPRVFTSCYLQQRRRSRLGATRNSLLRAHRGLLKQAGSVDLESPLPHQPSSPTPRHFIPGPSGRVRTAALHPPPVAPFRRPTALGPQSLPEQ